MSWAVEDLLIWPQSMQVSTPCSMNQLLLLEGLPYQHAGFRCSASTESHLSWPWAGRAARWAHAYWGVLEIPGWTKMQGSLGWEGGGESLDLLIH